MPLLFTAFLAGMLTVLAPCSLTLLPIILGQSAGEKSPRKAFAVIAALSVAIFVFTLILKATTLLIDIPTQFWSTISGIILIVFGVITLWPELWEKIPFVQRLQTRSGQQLQSSGQQDSLWGQFATGFALGPVFSSCSPTYSLIIVQILPAQPATGLLYLLAYILGLALLLVIVAVFGNEATRRLRRVANPRGYFKRGLGVLCVVIGIMILTGLDKQLETKLLEYEYLNLTNLEFRLIDEGE